MNATLVLVKPDGSTREVPVRGRLVIGREKSCSVRIPVPSVSREHCEVRLDGNRLVLRDMGSSNGTYVNRQRTEQRDLKPGDLVAIGPAVFLVRVDGQPATIDAAASHRNGAGPRPVAVTPGGAKSRPTAPGGMKPGTVATSDPGDSSIADFDFDFLDESDEDKKQPRL